MDIDIKLKHEPTHLTDYRMVKLTDGTLLVGSITVEGNFLRIENPLQLSTVNRMTDYGVKEDSTLSPWIPFCSETSFNISKDKIMVITKAAKELAHYYEVVLRKVKTHEDFLNIQLPNNFPAFILWYNFSVSFQASPSKTITTFFAFP